MAGCNFCLPVGVCRRVGQHGERDCIVLNKFHVLVCRGKGDYHRLGHGSDDHVRRPRQVQGLQGKKVIAIATGSLHCVCCSEDGRWKRFCNLEVCDLRGQG